MKCKADLPSISIGFGSTTQANTGWTVINDNVMGGASKSSFRVSENGEGIFKGTLSLENNGGFASVRSIPVSMNLSGIDAFLIRVRGDGRKYKFTVRTRQGFAAPVYQHPFTAPAGVWTEHHLRLRDFVPTYRGRTLQNAPQLTVGKQASIGFILADKQKGPFLLKFKPVEALILNPMDQETGTTNHRDDEHRG